MPESKVARNIRWAQERASAYAEHNLDAVLDAFPAWWEGRLGPLEWVGAVEYARREEETPREAARRLAGYCQLVAEREGVKPSPKILDTIPRGVDTGV